MKNCTRFTIIIILLASLTSCASAARFTNPGSDFSNELKEATPDFRQGWIDGCNSGSGSGSNSFNQMFHKNNQIDGYKMSYSPDYKIAWSNAWWYCYRKDWTNQRSTIYGTLFGGYR